MKKKTAAAGAALAVASLSIAANLLVTPTELLHSYDYLADHVRIQEQQTGQRSDVIYEYTEQQQLSVQDQVRAWIIRMPVALKALLILPLWIMGAVPVALGSTVGTWLAPFWSQILAFLLQAGIFAGLFCLVYKLLFPNKRVRDLFKKKNIPWFLGGAAGMTVLNMVLAQVWAPWSVVRIVLLCCAGFGILCLLYHRLCGKEKAPEPATVKTRLKIEYA